MKRTLQFLSLITLASGSSISVNNPLPDPALFKQGVLIAEDVLTAFDMNSDKKAELKLAIEKKYSKEECEKIFAQVDQQAEEGAHGTLFTLKLVAPDKNDLDEHKAKIKYFFDVVCISVVKRLGKEALRSWAGPRAINFDQPITFNQ